MLQRPSGEQKQQLAACSKRVAGAVTELIQTAEAMKGNDSQPTLYSVICDELKSTPGSVNLYLSTNEASSKNLSLYLQLESSTSITDDIFNF